MPENRRRDKDDDEDEELEADADRRIGSQAHVMTDECVIDDALQPADDVLQHRRPREHPDGLRQRAVDDAAVEFFLRRRRYRPWSIGHPRDLSYT